ncbi:MAG: iron complex outermembrane receptor protein [Cryomorphaceae bacterium]|jgi:iron complex outermembrane receptor protein
MSLYKSRQAIIFSAINLISLCSLNGQDFQQPIEDLDTSTVYADKLHKTWLDTEGSSADYSGDFLRQLNIRSEHDFISLVGGYLGNPTAGQFSIRGLNNDNILGYFGTRSNAVITSLVNGVPVSNATSRYLPQQTWGLGAVNVLFGGQSNTYGPNALGGVILYQSAAPVFDDSGSLYAEYGRFNTFRSGIEQNIKINNQTVFKFSYQRIASDGSVENTTLNSREWAKIDRHIFGAQGLWVSEEKKTELHATLKYDQSNSNPFGAVREFGGYSENDRKIDADTSTAYPADHWLGTLKLSHVTPHDLLFTNQFGVSTLNVESLIDLDGTALLPWFTTNDIDEYHLSNDFNIKGSTSRHIWSAGYYFQRSNYKIGFNGSGLVGTGIPFSSRAEEKVNIHALYAKDDYAINSNWHVVSGLRINYEDRELSSSAVTAISPTTNSRDKTSYTDLLPSLALVWKPEEDTTVGLKASRNYRGGGVSYAPTLGLTQTYSPEYSNDLELYYKAEPSDTLQLSSSIFYSRLDDMQVPVSVMGGIPDIDVLIQNSGKGRKFGAEAQALWEPVDNIIVDFSVNYTDTEFTDISINGLSLSGQEFPNAPRFTGRLSMGYFPESGFYGSTQFSFASSSYTQVTSDDATALSQRFNLNAKLGYKWHDCDVYVFADNLLGKDYPLGKVDASGLGAGVFTKMNEPRTYGLGLAFYW